MRMKKFLFIFTCISLSGIYGGADATVDVSGSIKDARTYLEQGEAFALQCTDEMHPGKCNDAGFDNGEDIILFFKDYNGSWGHSIWTCQYGYHCINNNFANRCESGHGKKTCYNASAVRRCSGLTGDDYDKCRSCSNQSNFRDWEPETKVCNDPYAVVTPKEDEESSTPEQDDGETPVKQDEPVETDKGSKEGTSGGGGGNASKVRFLCDDINLTDGMKPGQVKIVDCTDAKYTNLCYGDTKLQMLYIDYAGKCHEAEHECMPGYECKEDGSYYVCEPGTGSSICPNSYTFEDICDGLDDELETACIECFTNDWTAWDYEKKVCGNGRDSTSKRIEQIADELKTISDGFGQSRWKTKGGNFNGARLASDSIAGVVLGTAGGLITSHVIKSNQVKGGFEDLQCTVSGQVVSGYGDEFMVGRQ